MGQPVGKGQRQSESERVRQDRRGQYREGLELDDNLFPQGWGRQGQAAAGVHLCFHARGRTDRRRDRPTLAQPQDISGGRTERRDRTVNEHDYAA